MQKFCLIQPFYRVLWIQGIAHLVEGSRKLDASKVVKGQMSFIVFELK